MTHEDIVNEKNNKIKKLYIRYNDQEAEITVSLTETVGDLKNKIESIFPSLKGKLKKYKLRMKYRGQREGKLLDEDYTTLKDNHIISGSTIILGRTKNRGGIRNISY